MNGAVSKTIRFDRLRKGFAFYQPEKIGVCITNLEFFFVTGSSAHKNDATGNGRPAPLLAEPRYGAAPQPYGKYISPPYTPPLFVSLFDSQIKRTN